MKHTQPETKTSLVPTARRTPARPLGLTRVLNGRRGRDGGILLLLVIVLAAAAGAWKFGLFDKVMGTKEEVAIEGAPVRRGDLRISEIVRGNLEATDSISIKSQLEGRSTIIFLAEEGSHVKAGDLIVELDVSQLEDDLVRQEIEVKNAEASFTKAREQYDIQVIQNQSDLAEADLALELAELDLEKYVGSTPADGSQESSGDSTVPKKYSENGEYSNELAKIEENLFLKREDLEQAKTDLSFSDELLEIGFIQPAENESAKLAVERAQIQLTQVERERDLMKRFSFRRNLAQLNADVATCNRNIEKVKKQATARLADYEAERESAAYTLERERNQLAELRGQVEKAKIYAPEDGLLVYARERSRWGDGDTVAEGDEVRERQELCTIPRAGGMTVKASIHETKLKKVQVGQACVVSVDAFPGRTFDGRVNFVAVMADSGSWRSNPNQRLYKADISLTSPTRDMRPGMSCSVEILVEDLADATYVPRQCVFLDGGETISFVVENGVANRRPVKVGLDNTKWVSIEEGLEEGDVVALAPPADFEPAPMPEADMEDFGQRPAVPPVGGDSARKGAGAKGAGRPGGGGRPSGKGGRGAGGRDSSGKGGGGRPSGQAGADSSAGGAPKAKPAAVAAPSTAPAGAGAASPSALPVSETGQ